LAAVKYTPNIPWRRLESSLGSFSAAISDSPATWCEPRNRRRADVVAAGDVAIAEATVLPKECLRHIQYNISHDQCVTLIAGLEGFAGTVHIEDDAGEAIGVDPSIPLARAQIHHVGAVSFRGGAQNLGNFAG